MRAILAIFLLSTAVLWADGGVVLTRQKVDGLDITVFASPVPLRAGPADLSVLVQESGKSAPALDADVEIAWSAEPGAFPAWMPPCCSMEKGDKFSATLGHSQNKTLYSAIVPIKSAGPSRILIRVQKGDQVVSVPCEIEAAPPQPPMLAYWPFLAFPPVGVFAFVLHQRLSRRRGS